MPKPTDTEAPPEREERSSGRGAARGGGRAAGSGGDEAADRTGRRPHRIRDLDRGTLWPTLKRTVSEFQEDELTDRAAALTYYGVLSLFPALIVLVSLLGLFGNAEDTTRILTEIITGLGPASAADAFAGPVESVTANRGAAGVLFVVGLAAALFSASGYIGAFMRASNKIYEVGEGRPFWKLRPLQMAIALVMVILLALTLLALVVSGPLVDAVAGPLGIGDVGVTLYTYAKWPVLLAVVMAMVALLYYIAPNVKQPGIRWVTPGSLLALLLWILASAGFAFYVANFGSYDKTYGTLGGVITFLVWVWITNVAVLLGAELNAELERSRELEAGVPDADREIQLAPREEPDEPKTK
jgi:membrane protein